MPSLSNLNLFAYNSVQAIAWAVCLSRSLSSVLSTKGLNGAYASAGDLIFLCQMVAFLEVVHGAIGPRVASSLDNFCRMEHKYTAFLVLYPPGMGCETWLMYQALPFMKKYSFSYYNVLMVVLFCYPFFCVKLYLHMVKQRRSKLGKQDKEKQKVNDH